MQTDLLVLGTGITARTTIQYLQNHPDRSTFTFAIAGRSRAKLQTLVDELDLPASVPVKVVDVEDTESVDQAVQSTKVVINTVGPYWFYGTAVVRACVHHGVHHVDLSGEAQWIKAIITEFDYAASKKGSIIIPSCGMDSVPSDLTAYLGHKTLSTGTQDLNVLVDSSITAYKFHGAFSGGTIQSIVAGFDSVPRRVMMWAGASYALSPVTGIPDARPPVVHELPIPKSTRSLIGTYFPMSFINRGIVHRSYGLKEYQHITAPTKETARARYGPNFKYSEFMVTSSRATALFVSFTMLIGFAAIAIAPIRAIIKPLLPKSGHGPKTEKELHSGFLEVTNVTSAVGQDLQAITTFKGKGDPGYYLTCFMLAESGLALLEPEKLSPFVRRGGVLTTAVAIGDQLVERLNKSGKIQIESRLIKSTA
ncbi:hypothetical protein CYLTODRAFT_442431 [Cylindrobasidium torrendii FP15055 ss-10]|uniref:Saccharopine dehydrogenase NADP binding domain-containing protein n=1 Tax=Cylindrobasidium torrendii FP15055 ss-10 TaxID=1314674 RepID=A0A0D7BGU1_9AGAR|nr:hypothetical protein CYLTODRAFT_442431 [Cylindrobasidium torrendii FP15055 ss-10]